MRSPSQGARKPEAAASSSAPCAERLRNQRREVSAFECVPCGGAGAWGDGGDCSRHEASTAHGRELCSLGAGWIGHDTGSACAVRVGKGRSQCPCACVQGITALRVRSGCMKRCRRARLFSRFSTGLLEQDWCRDRRSLVEGCDFRIFRTRDTAYAISCDCRIYFRRLNAKTETETHPPTSVDAASVSYSPPRTMVFAA